jgi:hypothetical protein
LKLPPNFSCFIQRSFAAVLLWVLFLGQKSGAAGCSFETILSRSSDPSTLPVGKRCE